MTTITRPCPHCGKDYDISTRILGDQVRCSCGGWSLVVMYPDGRTKLVKSLALEPASETTADAALISATSAVRAELEAVKAEAAALRTAATDLYNQLQTLRHPDMSTLWRLGGQPLEDAFEAQKAALISGAGRLLLAELEATREDNAMLLSVLREIDFDFDKLSPRNQRLLNRISEAEHPGRALMAELTRRMSALERERDEAVAFEEDYKVQLEAAKAREQAWLSGAYWLLQIIHKEPILRGPYKTDAEREHELDMCLIDPGTEYIVLIDPGYPPHAWMPSGAYRKERMDRLNQIED